MANSKKLQNFYQSDAWVTLRLSLILERGNKCCKCEKIIVDSKQLIGHHRIELTDENVDDASISLNPDLIDIICFNCHNIMHSRFGHNEKKVYLVHGSPQSGKKTYVMQNKMANDLVVDMNMLYQAVTGFSYGNKPNSLFKNVLRIRDCMIDMIKTRYGNWGTAWIIGGFPDKYQREMIARDTGAEIIHIDTSKDECIARLKGNESLKYRQHEWIEYIDNYWKEYTE